MYGVHAQIWLDLNEYNILVPYHPDSEISENPSLFKICQVLFSDAKQKIYPTLYLQYDHCTIAEIENVIDDLNRELGQGIVEDYILRVKISVLMDIISELEESENTEG